MRILRVLLAYTTIVFSITTFYGQEKNPHINEPSAVTNLLDLKKTHNSSTITNDKYKIQVFYGKNTAAQEALQKFRLAYPNLDATIIYSAPSYKVMVGNFKTRLEAEKHMRIIKMDFPNSFIIRPGK
ncbi:SPOR domain-containing protein [Myroides sp. LJL115]